MFYKYRKLYTEDLKFNEHTLRILEDRKIYIPSHKELNDPWEKIIEIPVYKTYTQDEENELIQIDKQSKELGYDEFFNFGKETIETFKDIDSSMDEINHYMFDASNVGIFSMSTLNDSILLWSHYGDEHRGICIGFDKQDFLDTGNVVKVKYRKKVYSIDPKHHYRKPEKQYFGNKHFSWLYEKEYRYLHPESSVEIISPAKINSIFLGLRVDKSIVEEIRKKFSSMYSVYIARMNTTSYTIDYEKIT